MTTPAQRAVLAGAYGRSFTSRDRACVSGRTQADANGALSSPTPTRRRSESAATDAAKLFRTNSMVVRMRSASVRAGKHWGRRLGWLGAQLVVIALGVAAGLAVDQWRQRRSDRDVELHYLRGLRADLASDTAEFSAQSRWALERAAVVCRTVDGLGGPGAVPEDTTVLNALSWALNQSLPVVHDGTYQQLISQGALGRISSGEIRDSLQSYHARIAQALTLFAGWEEWRRFLERYSMESLPYAGYRYALSEGRFSPSTKEGADELRSVPSSSSVHGSASFMRSDSRMRNMLQRSCASQRRMSGWDRGLAQRAKALLASVTAEIEHVGKS